MSKAKKNERYFMTEEILNALVAEYEALYGVDEDPKKHEWGVTDWVGCSIMEAEFVGTAKFENLMEMVFPFGGKKWAVHFESNTGACYDDFFGIGRCERPWKVECSGFTCFEVHEVTKTIKTWEPVLLRKTDD